LTFNKNKQLSTSKVQALQILFKEKKQMPDAIIPRKQFDLKNKNVILHFNKNIDKTILIHGNERYL